MSQAGPGGGNALEVALRYAIEAAEQVTPQMLPLPTPCRGWDLRMLLLHASDSVAVLTEGFEGGHVGQTRPEGDQAGPADPAGEFGRRAQQLLGSSALTARLNGVVTVSGCPMRASLMATAGALELAVHGWDIAQTCGGFPPIPTPLALDLLRAAPLLITRADRQQLFAAPVAASSDSSPGDRLAAYLGRPAV
jgi:uncharacterized protein (TIGR03086 family)